MKSGKMKIFSSFLKQDLQLHHLFPWKNAEESIQISKEELDEFVLLAQTDLPFEECIQLSFRQSESCMQLLEEGHSLESVFQHSSTVEGKMLASLVRFLPLSKAVSCVESIFQSKKQLSSLLVSQGAYPLFLIALASFLLGFFNSSIVPAMSSFLSPDSLMPMHLLNALVHLFWLLFLPLACLCILAWYGWLPEPLAHRVYGTFPFFRLLVSLQLTLCWKACFAPHLSSKEILSVLSTLPGCPFTRHVSRLWLNQLNDGHSLEKIVEEDPLLHPFFIRFFQLGLQSHHLEQILDSLSRLLFRQLQTTLKKYARILQMASYLLVACLAMNMYDVLLAPMNILESI